MRKLFALMLLPHLVFAGWVLGNENKNGNITAPATSTSTTLAVTAADLVVAWVACGAASTPGSVSDTVNTYTNDVSVSTNRGVETLSIFHTIAASTTTYTITASCPAANDTQLYVKSFRNTGGAVPGTVNTTVSDAALISLTLTTNTANTLLAAVGDCSSSIAVGTGYTTVVSLTADGILRTLAEYNASANSTGSNSASVTGCGATHGLVAVAYNPPASATSAVKHRVIQ